MSQLASGPGVSQGRRLRAGRGRSVKLAARGKRRRAILRERRKQSNKRRGSAAAKRRNPSRLKRSSATLPHGTRPSAAAAPVDVFSESPPVGQARVVTGRSGDHAAVYHMLLAVFQGPSRDEFQAQGEEPFYEPSDRLLVKRGFRVLAHLQLTRRTMEFGSLRLPVAGVHWLGTLPEFRRQGFATQLLAEAQWRMVADGAVLALTRTKIPRFFHRAGWALCGRHSFSHTKARDVMGCLQTDFASQLASPLSIRLWRHVEMPALMRIYRQNTAGGYGALERSEAYWRWTVGRKAYDALLVALDGPDKLELEESIAPIVGYAVLRQERVVELMTTPGHPTAHYQLLARAAREVIEHDRQDLFLCAPPTHALHRVMCEAGGALCHQEADAQQEVYMVKVVDPLKFLTMIGPELEARAKQAGLARETELGFNVDGTKWRLAYTRRGMRVRGGSLGRSYLTMNRAEFTRLALGHGSVRETAFAGRIQASTQTALDLADALFPRLPFYRPVWDELGA
jgi:predicted acetyltransferase